MKNINMRKNISEFARITLGVFAMALAINLVFEPMGLVTGGVSGMAIVIKRVTKVWIPGGVPVWVTNFVVNIPIFAAALWIKGKKYIGKTVVAHLLFTIALMVIPVVSIVDKDYVLATAVGGVVSGIGLGLVFSAGGSTGGTDLLSVIIHHFFPYYSMAKLLFVLDVMVILSGAFIFGIPSAIYASISVYLTSRLMDSILEGMHFAKGVLIISDDYKSIGEEVMGSINRGATVISASGMYTGDEKPALLCVVGRKEVTKLTKIAKEKDPNAFIIISDVREVFGEGFVENRQ